MANCSTCGTSTGIMGPKECASCRDKREAQESATSERQRAAEVAEARQELLAIRQEIFDDEYEQVAATVAGGADAYLYRSVYVAVDSIHDEQEIADEFDIEPVRMLGRMGWEAVSVVPRTLGTSLQNISIGASSGRTYGGGIGGTVVGVHVLLRYRITLANLSAAIGILAGSSGLDEFPEARLPAPS